MSDPPTGALPGLVGVVLAAGSGVRAGGPKGMRRADDGTPWVVSALDVLRDAGCARLLVVTGAWAAAVAALVPEGVDTVDCIDWNAGLSASFRTGLAAVSEDRDATAVLLTLVDLPGMPSAVAQRVVAAGALDSRALRRAAVGGIPTHPVLLGRDHWSGASELANGDKGAGPYLRQNNAHLVDVGELWDGADVDGPAARRGAARRDRIDVMAKITTTFVDGWPMMQPLARREQSMLAEHLEPGETVLGQVIGTVAQAIVATDRRVLVLKSGVSSGHFFGGITTSYDYGEIRSVELRSSIAQGELEIVTESRVINPWDTRRVRLVEEPNGVVFSKLDREAFTALAGWIRKRSVSKP